MNRSLFSHVLTVLVIVWLAAIGVVGFLYPERTKELLQKAIDVRLAGVAAPDDAARKPAEKDAGGSLSNIAPWKSPVATLIGEPTTASSTNESAATQAGVETWLTKVKIESIAENTLGNWTILVSAIFIGFLAGKLTGVAPGGVGRKLDAREWTARAHLANDLIGPAGLALFTLGLGAGLAGLWMSNELRGFLRQIQLLLYLIAIFWYGYNLVAVVDVGLRRMTARSTSKLDSQLVPLVRKTLRIVLVVIGSLYIAESVFGGDIGAWLAGFGIAGLAVSLAAQDSLKSLFGSIAILFDRPFGVGDRIIHAGHDGVVEEIGFRSTKIRTGLGSLVTIPNSTIAAATVENAGRRSFIQRTVNLTIAHDTPRAKVERMIQTLRAILEEDGLREPIHVTIRGEAFPPRVFFKDFETDGLTIAITYWYAPPKHWDYMDHAQRLNLRILEEFEKAEIAFAFPGKAVYLGGETRRRAVFDALGKNA